MVYFSSDLRFKMGYYMNFSQITKELQKVKIEIEFFIM